MLGAILGDMIGAPYEFDRSPKVKEFPLFSRHSQFTDDTVMTIAVAEALMNTLGKTDDEIKAALVSSMQTWGRHYPYAGYGSGCTQRTQSPMAASGTEAPCGSPPRAGCLTASGKHAVWRV